jgi:hypothetical protein
MNPKSAELIGIPAIAALPCVGGMIGSVLVVPDAVSVGVVTIEMPVAAVVLGKEKRERRKGEMVWEGKSKYKKLTTQSS